MDLPVGSTSSGAELERRYGKDLFSRSAFPQRSEQYKRDDAVTWSRVDKKDVALSTPEDNRAATFIRTK